MPGSLTSWREFVHCKVPVVMARVEEIVRRVSGPRVLEVGCNEGFVARAIEEERGFEVVAVDSREEAVNTARSLFGLDAVQASVYELPFKDGAFDCVVGGEILEHLENPGSGLSEMFRVSKGHVVLTLPFGRYWNDELSHAWQINGSMVDHDGGWMHNFFKNALVFEFRRIRRVVDGGGCEAVGPYHEDR